MDQQEPAGLKAAALAWAAPFPGDKSDEQAVVYQFAWTNPRPEVAIESIDMLYGPAGPHTARRPCWPSPRPRRRSNAIDQHQ